MRWAFRHYHTVVFADEIYWKLSPGVNGQNYRMRYERGCRTLQVESKLILPKPKKSLQIGFVLVLSSMGILLIMKDRGESWDQRYFQNTLIPLIQKVTAFPLFVSLTVRRKLRLWIQKKIGRSGITIFLKIFKLYRTLLVSTVFICYFC